MNDFFLRASPSSSEEVFKKSETLKKDSKSKDEMSIPSSSQNSFKKPAGLLSKKRWKKLKSHYIPSGTNTKQIISSEEDSEDLSKREIEIISHYDEPQEANKDLFPQNASERSEDAEKKVLGHVCLSKEAHGDQDDISSTTGSLRETKNFLNSSPVIRFRERFGRYKMVWKHSGFGTVSKVTKKKH